MIIYTASDCSYADSVLDFIDPLREFFKIRLYRSNCVKIKKDNGYIYIKDLRIIKNVPLKDMVIIDNSVLSFAFHLENGIPVLPFYNNTSDTELIYLRDYLMELYKSDDIKSVNAKVFNLKKYISNPNEDVIYLDKYEELNNEKVKGEISAKQSLETTLNQPIRRKSSMKNQENTLQNARKHVLTLNTVKNSSKKILNSILLGIDEAKDLKDGKNSSF